MGDIETCGKCMGSGYGGHPDSGVLCSDCNGTGGVPPPRPPVSEQKTMRGVRVKPLVWEKDASNSWVAGPYSIHHRWPHNDGPFIVSAYFANIGAAHLGSFSTLEAAKAAAQADYEARILAALEVVPLAAYPAVKALVEAAVAAERARLLRPGRGRRVGRCPV